MVEQAVASGEGSPPGRHTRGFGTWHRDSLGARWVVVSAGPSLAGWDPQLVTQRAWEGQARIVAVNRALAWLDGYARYWIVSERPEVVWNSLGLERCANMLARGRATVWCPDVEWEASWRRHLPGASLEPYPIRDWSSDDPSIGRVSPGWETAYTWNGASMVHALARCCAKGAREIHVIGCDMRGSGGWGYRFQEEETERWAARWERERKSVEMAVQDAREHGVTIDLWQPGTQLGIDAQEWRR